MLILLNTLLLLGWASLESEAFSWHWNNKKTEFMRNKDAILPGPWNDQENYKRNIASNCRCGEDFTTGDPIWNLYISATTNKEKFCTGTIITSNLVATAHECIHKGKKPLNVYDTWNKDPNQRTFLMENEIVVSTLPNALVAETFEVEKIIYNLQFLMNMVLLRNVPKKLRSLIYGEQDLLLLKVKANFADHPKLRPICLPRFDKDLTFVNQIGLYYAERKEGRLLINSANYTVGVHEGVILTKGMCESHARNNTVQSKNSQREKLEPLCFKWNSLTGVLPSKVKGGPLILLNTNNKSTSFLIGLASQTKIMLTSYGTNYGFFSNIMVLLKYIEFQAIAHDSKWCQAPPLVLSPALNGKAGESEDGSPWPWNIQRIISVLEKREESLDCVCGLVNPSQGGRIVGGVTAGEREFGWMAIMNLYHTGRASGRVNLCGGAIINDRVILTAAHCVVSEPGYKVIDPDDITLQIWAHKRRNDEKAIEKKVDAVLFHPDYIPAKKRGYFDYDVALLVLKEPIEFVKGNNKGIRPVCLPKMNERIEIKIRQLVTISGWGLTNPDVTNTAADLLQKIELPVITLEDCRRVAVSKITDNFLCIGSLNRFKDAASGDSGGPVQMMVGEQYYEVGLVSWGEDNGSKTAALYTDVQNMLPFIEYHSKRAQANWCKSNT